MAVIDVCSDIKTPLESPGSVNSKPGDNTIKRIVADSQLGICILFVRFKLKYLTLVLDLR